MCFVRLRPIVRHNLQEGAPFVAGAGRVRSDPGRLHRPPAAALARLVFAGAKFKPMHGMVVGGESMGRNAHRGELWVVHARGTASSALLVARSSAKEWRRARASGRSGAPRTLTATPPARPPAPLPTRRPPARLPARCSRGHEVDTNKMCKGDVQPNPMFTYVSSSLLHRESGLRYQGGPHGWVLDSTKQVMANGSSSRSRSFRCGV